MTSEERMILRAELYKLSLPAKNILEKFLEEFDTPIADALTVAEAKNFIAELSLLSTDARTAKKALIDKLNPAVHVLCNESEVWQSLENLPHEEWRNIAGYEEIYQVSNFGRVKSFHKGKVTIRKFVTLEHGYQQVSLDKGGKRKCKNVHVLVAKLFIANPNNKLMADHYDTNTANNCVWNLNRVTNGENQRHAIELGTKRSGCDSPRSKLTLDQVREIRCLYVRGSHDFGSRALAEKFGVTRSTIKRIVNGQSYRNVI